MQLNTFTVTLEQKTKISLGVSHFIFRCNNEPPFSYLPGQFITIHFEHEGKTLRRSYSIATAPSHNNCIEFAAGYVEGGPGTDLLFNLNPGDTLQMNGPFGRLTLKDTQASRYILVATSTGVTPYRSMIPELTRRLQSRPDLNVVILQGVQTRADVLYAEDFLAFAASFPQQVMFRVHLSRENPADRQLHEATGHVQSAFSALKLNPVNDLIYLCGNPSMIDDAFTSLKDNGFETQHIIREKYISK